MSRHPGWLAALAALVGVVGGCKTVGQAFAETEGTRCAQDSAACLQRVLDRHGGLERFRAHRYAQYTVADDFQFPFSLAFNPWPDRTSALVMTADRTNGEQVIHFPGSTALMGVDAQGGWGTQKGTAHGATKIGTLTAYEFTLPFRLADDHVRIEKVYAQRWHDFAVVTLDVVFDPKITRAANDHWSIHIEPRTQTLLGASFFFTEDKAPVDLEYQDWHLVDGMLIPKVISIDVAPLHLLVRKITVTQVKLFDAPPSDWVPAPPGAERDNFVDVK